MVAIIAALFVATTAFAGKALVSWPGGTKPEAIFNYNGGTNSLYVAWIPATGDVSYYNVCYTVKGYGTQCQQLEPTNTSMYFGVVVYGSYSVTVTAYDGNNDSVTIRTRLMIP